MAALADTRLAQAPALETDTNGLQRLKFLRGGWNFWTWKGNQIHYIQAGDVSKPPVILVHGFGASAYHWRYAVPELAKKYSVYAIDLLGFGLSEKPSVVYNGYSIWSEQLRDFVREVIGGRPAVMVGNSMGAYASLLTSAYYPAVSRGVVLVNGAGRFEEVKATMEAGAEAAMNSTASKEAFREATGVSSEMPGRTVTSASRSSPVVQSKKESPPAKGFMESVLQPVQALAKRAAVYVAFIAAKQPSRIRQVLQQVYISKDNIDQDLIDSIALPAQDSNAPEVFYRVITSQGESINSLLQKIQAPIFLLWGELDPWITPASADRIQRLFPAAERVDIAGGHCPHDDVPQLFLPPLNRWLESHS